MRSIVRRITFLMVLATLLSVQAWAGQYTVIVHVADGANIKAIAEAYDGKVLDTLDTNTYLLQLKLTSPRYAVTGVEWMESDQSVGPSKMRGAVVSVTARTAPNWYVQQPAFQLIRETEALQLSRGSGIVVADINSLVDYSHPALRGHLTSGFDFVLGKPSDVSLNQSTASFLDQSTASFLDQSTASFLDQSTASFLDQSTASFLDQSTASFLDASNPAHGHGTLVAGIIAAIAPDALIMPIRAFDDQGQSDQFTIAKAIYWAVDHGADVINMSFGTMEKSKVLKDAIEYANKQGVTLVASAGNDNTETEQYPASYDKVIAVAATNLWDMKTSFSNFGKAVDVSAPGASIIAPYPNGYYAIVSGTSFASPIVAGEAALLRSLLQKENMKDRIRKNVIKIDHRNPGWKMGEGRIDIRLALEKK
jgi:Subtilisin-like serine proteases